MSDLSPEAKAWLATFKLNPNLAINYKTIKRFGASKSKSLAILKELRDANLLEIIKKVGGGTVVKVTSADVQAGGTSDVQPGGTSGYRYTAVQLVRPISNSSTARTTVKATNKFFDEVEEEGLDMGWNGQFGDMSTPDDDTAGARQRHQAQKNAEYAEARAKTAGHRKQHRSQLAPSTWTCKDVAYEFADRMSNLWSIKPFQVSQSRFVQALAGFRKQYETDGALELEMIEMFFSSLNAEKYNDGNHLWRAFMFKAPSLVQTARERVVTDEQIETAIIEDQELTNRKLALLEDDDV